MELKAEFTRKADRPVFSPVRMWSLSPLLATKYPATIPPSTTMKIEAISISGSGASSGNNVLTAYVKNKMGAFARNPPARYSSKPGALFFNVIFQQSVTSDADYSVIRCLER